MTEGPGQVSVDGMPATAYRCFLFADLRGYTAYIERAGNTAGADLVKDYLSITRTAVERFHGAEIKVEGDGFHAVFPSASSAVMCGLAIIDAAHAATLARPDRPIRVGVGIHAGEAVETPEGFIGSAVNMASRVCAAAAPGELLVTGTVRGITQASIEVGFAPRGKQRLKGINEPVELFTVTHGLSAPGRRTVGRRWLAAIGLGAVAVLALALVAIALPGFAPRPTATPIPTPQALAVGPLELGEYVANDFNPVFSFTIDDPGWSVYRVYPDALGLHYQEAIEGRLDIGNIPLLYGNACAPQGSEIPTGTSADDLVAALRSVPHLQVGEETAAEIGGNFALQVDVTVDQGVQAACGGFGTEGIPVFRVAEDEWNAMPGEVFRVQAVDVDATTVSFLMSAEPAPASSVAALEEVFEKAQRIVQSVNF